MKYISLFILLIGFQLVHAQTEDDLEIENLEVIKAFEAQLGEAKRIQINPETRDPIVKKLDYKYDVSIVPMKIEYPDPVIRPLAKKPDARKTVHTNWLKLGYATLKRPEADAGYQLYLEDLYSITVRGTYEGGQQDLDSLYGRKYDAYKISGDGHYFIKDNIQLDGGVSYDRSSRSLYGYHSTVEDSLTNSRTRNGLDLYAAIRNRIPIRGKIHYNLGLKTNITRIGDQATEEFNAALPIELGIAFKEGQFLRINSYSEFSSSDVPTYQDGFLSYLNPYLNSDWGFATAHLGVAALYSKDLSQVFPDIEITVPILDKRYFIFAGADMDYHRNNIWNTSAYNPFVNTKQIDNSVAANRNIYGGVRTDIFGLQIDAKAGYKFIDNELFFSNDIDDIRYFDYATVDGDAIFLSGTFNYVFKSWIEWTGEVKQHIYNFDTAISENLHLPTFQGKSTLILQNASHKWHVNTSLSFSDKVDARQVIQMGTNEFTRLNNQFDFSIGGDYYITDHIALYANANNLFDNNYERWYLYRGFGRNFSGGIKAKF